VTSDTDKNETATCEYNKKIFLNKKKRMKVLKPSGFLSPWPVGSSILVLGDAVKMKEGRRAGRR
jgi:hypothetical protein